MSYKCSTWSDKVSSLNQTGHHCGIVEGSNINSPILQQATPLPVTVSQQHNYLSHGYLNLNQGYQDRYLTNVSPFVSTSSNDLNQMILSSASIVRPSATNDNKLVATQLKVPVGASSLENTGEGLESNRKICTDFINQNLPNNHLNIQPQHGTCYDYNAIGTRFALLLESLKSSMANKNAPTHSVENPKSLADTIHLYQQHQTQVNNIQHQGSNNTNSQTEFLERHQIADNLRQLASLHSRQQSGNSSRYIPDDNYQFANVEQGLNKARFSQNYTSLKINNQITNSTASNSSTSSSPRD